MLVKLITYSTNFDSIVYMILLFLFFLFVYNNNNNKIKIRIKILNKNCTWKKVYKNDKNYI